MSARLQRPGVPRLAFRVAEAAEAIGVSPDFFSEHVARDLRWVRRGAVKIVSRAELEAWLEREASLTVDEDAA